MCLLCMIHITFIEYEVFGMKCSHFGFIETLKFYHKIKMYLPYINIGHKTFYCNESGDTKIVNNV